jgi:cobalt/nickel transport system permease protein
MRADFLDRHSRDDSPIHRLAAGTKLLLALLLLFTILLVPLAHWPLHAGIGAILLAIARTARVPFRFLAVRLLWLEPLVLGIAVLTLLQPGGLATFTAIVLRSTLCLLTMLLLASTTPFPALLEVLRRLRVPALLVTTLALMYRYLFVLVDEAQRMQRARQSRTFDGRRWHGWQVLATVLGQLFVRSTARAERIYHAMLARGHR